MFDSSLGDPLVYWILRISLLLILTYSGYKIANIKTFNIGRYWIMTIVPGMSYSLFYGLRWMRGADYVHYATDIVRGTHSNYIDNSTELLYRLWCDFCCNNNISPEIVFTIYAALFIFGVFAVLQHYPQAAFWALPMTVFITGGSVECHFRQYFAISFILFAFAFYLDVKRVAMFLCLIVSFFIHYSTIFPIILLLLTLFIKERVKLRNSYLYMLVSVFLALALFWDQKYLGPYAQILSTIRLDSDIADLHMVTYIEDSDRWFSENGSLSLLKGNKSTSSLLFRLVQQLTIISVIVTGYKAAIKDSRLFPVFVFTYLSYIIFVIGGDIEIINRIGIGVAFFTPIMLGTGISNETLPGKYVLLATGSYLFYYVFYLTIRNYGNPGEFGCAFIWDK